MRKRHWIALGLALASFGLYAPIAQHDFLDYDDTKHIAQNPDVQAGFGPASVWKVFTRPHYGDFVPLTYVSLQLDRSLFGPGPRGVLRTNAALHALNAALCFWVWLALSGAPGRSLAVAALFALHPLRVESVAWAFERKDVLCAFFWLLAMAAHVVQARRPSAAARAATALAGLAALLSKPTAVTLPFALLLLDYWPLRRLGAAGRAWPEPARVAAAVREKAALFALTGAWLLFTLVAHARSASLPEAAQIPPTGRALEAVVSLGFYLAKTVWPVGLAVFQPHSFGAPGAAALGLSAGVALALSAAALAAARTRPYLLFGWLWFLVTLLPMLGGVQLGLHVRADRYTYLPHLGLAVAAVWGVAGVLPATRAGRRAGAALAVAVAGVLAALSWRQIGVWRDTRHLFEHALAVTEGNFVAHWRLGVDHARAGRLEAAVDQLEASVEAFPDLATTRFELAQALEEAGRGAEALPHYEAALALEPGHLGAAERYGIALAGRGRHERARALLEGVVRRDAGRARAWAALAALAEADGRDAEAVAHYRQALRLEPDYLPALNNLAGLLGRVGPPLGDAEEALRLARRAARSSAEAEPAVLDTLARALAASGRPDEAADVAERALGLAKARGDADLADAIARWLRALKEPERPTEE